MEFRSAANEFCSNTIIRGKLQELSPPIERWQNTTSGELRATGEWELLLSESLLGAFLRKNAPS